MSEWFQSIPQSLDSIVYAAKVRDRFLSTPGTMSRPLAPLCLQFQLDVMASQVRYHRSKYQQLRQFVERLKRDLTELKKYDFIYRSRSSRINVLLLSRP
jgi:hypothetical protein